MLNYREICWPLALLIFTKLEECLNWVFRSVWTWNRNCHGTQDWPHSNFLLYFGSKCRSQGMISMDDHHLISVLCYKWYLDNSRLDVTRWTTWVWSSLSCQMMSRLWCDGHMTSLTCVTQQYHHQTHTSQWCQGKFSPVRDRYMWGLVFSITLYHC